jgi:hypothetical protein
VSGIPVILTRILDQHLSYYQDEVRRSTEKNLIRFIKTFRFIMACITAKHMESFSTTPSEQFLISGMNGMT